MLTGHAIGTDETVPLLEPTLRGNRLSWRQRITKLGLSAEGSDRTYEIAKFCPRCGAPVLLICESCRAPIPNPRGGNHGIDESPPFCTRCGSPFPWATREERAGQLVALLEHEQLDDVVRLAAIEAIEELVAAEPDDDAEQIRLTGRLRQLVPGAWEWMKPILQSVLTEAAKQGTDLA